MNIFDNSDIANYQDSVAKANQTNQTEEQKIERRQNAQDKETDSYNDTLKGILDPIGGELLRKPLEGLVHDTLKKGIRKLTGKATVEGKKIIKTGAKKLAEKLGVTDEQISGLTNKLSSVKLPDSSVVSQFKSTIPAKLDNDTAKILNKTRNIRGKAPKINTAESDIVDGEPRVVDAFSGKPIVPKSVKQPLFEGASEDDWVDKIYNSNATDTAKTLRSAKAKVPTQAPPEPAPKDPATKSLDSIFDDQDDVSKAVDFKGKRIPQPKVDDLSDLPSIEELQGKVAPPVLDQLAPMRQLQQQQAESANKSLIDTAKPLAPTADPTAPPAPTADPTAPTAKPTAPPAGEEPPGGQTLGSQAEKEAGSVVEKDVGKTVGKSAGDAVLESEAVLGGPEDPLADIVGLFAGLGTLLGGAFGGEKPKPPPIPQAQLNPSSTFGI